MALTQLIPSGWLRRDRSPVVGNSLTSRSSSLLDSDDPFVRMHEAMDRLFDSVFDASNGWMVQPGMRGAALLTPSLDIAETEKAYQLAVELPGVDLNDIRLTTQEDALLIRAERKQINEDNGTRYHRVERRTGHFERVLTLPADADTDNISAEFRNGVLEITVPRRQDVESLGGRRVEIKAA